MEEPRAQPRIAPPTAPADTAEVARADVPTKQIELTPHVEPLPHVPGYEILGELGRGGMGVVYQARQLGLNRFVALKMLGQRYRGKPEAVQRFCREAEAIALLQHPHIIPIYEINTGKPDPFFTMEFAAGGNLADLWDSQPRKADEIARLGILLARAVHAAHERGIIHRDLKPANILIVNRESWLVNRDEADSGAAATARADQARFTMHDARFTPKITDFGLVRRLDEEDGLARAGVVIGTPGYMAPEQVSIDLGPISPAADVYALGVLLYEGLTGGPPCRGLSSVETLQLTLVHEPLPPSQLRPHVPRDLEIICLKCLEKEPRRRYRSAADLADDLQRFLDGVPIRARPTPAWERGWKWARRHPAISALAALVVAVTVASFAGLTALWNEAERERQRAEKERGRAVATAVAEKQSRREAQRLSSQMLLERGVNLCNEGDLAAGTLWLARGLEVLPDDEVAGRESFALLLGGWRDQLHVPTAYFRAEQDLTGVHLARQGKVIVGVTNKSVNLWPAPGTEGTALRLSHPKGVYCVAISHDGDTLATGSPDGLLRVWTVGSDTPRLELPHPQGVRTMAFHPDGTVLVSGCLDGKVRLWHLATGKLAAEPLVHDGPVRALALSPDGKTLATTGDDGTLRLWDATSGQPAGSVCQHSGPVYALAISPDGKTIASGGHDRRIKLWALADGTLVSTLDEHSSTINVLAFSPDSRLLVSGSDDHRAIVWEVDSGKEQARLRHQHGVGTIAFSPDGRLIATGSYDNTARLWTLAGRPIGHAMRHTGDVNRIVFMPDGKTLLSAGEDATVRVWSLALPALPERLLPHPQSVLCVAVSPDGNTVATGCVDHRVRLWDASGTARELRMTTAPFTVAFHPGGDRLLVGTDDGQVRFFDTKTLQPCGHALQHRDRVLCAAYSPDGTHVLTGCDDHDAVARLWEVASGQVVYTYRGHERKIPGVAFHPDGNEVATASWDKTARRWSASSGQVLAMPLAHLDLVQALVYSPDGRLLLTGGDDYMTRLLDVGTGRPTGIPVRHSGKIQAVQFSPDGKMFAVGSKDQSARLFETRTGQPIGPPLLHQHEVHSLAFRPDGRILFSGSWDGSAGVWRVPQPWAADSPAVKRWLQVTLGQRLDENGVLTDVDVDTWCRLFREGQSARGK